MRSGVVEDSAIKMILDNPAEYIESAAFFSWERFFTEELVKRTEHTYLKYSKRSLNPAYIQGSVKEKILNTMEHINLKL